MKKIILMLTMISFLVIGCNKIEMEEPTQSNISNESYNKNTNKNENIEIIKKVDGNLTTYQAFNSGVLMSELNFDENLITTMFSNIDPNEDVFLRLYDNDGELISSFDMEGDINNPLWQYLLIYCTQFNISYGSGGWSGSLTFDCFASFPTNFTISR